MNKAELTAEVAERVSGVDADARQYVDAVFDVIMGRVAAGERVQILGFGTFDSTQRAARVGRNPRTGEAIQVPAGVSPRFHAGQKFRAQVTDGMAVAEAPVSVSVVVAESEVAVEVAEAVAVAEVAAKPAKVKKSKAAPEKKAAKPADKKAAKPAGSKAPKTVKIAKKSAKPAAKAGKAAKVVKAAKAGKK